MQRQGFILARPTSEIDDLIEKANAFVHSAKAPVLSELTNPIGGISSWV